MKHLRRIMITVGLLLLMNCAMTDRPLFLFAAAVPVFLLVEILPCYEKGLSFRLQVLSGGYELIVTSFWRVALSSSQLGIGLRAAMLFFWWFSPEHRVSAGQKA